MCRHCHLERARDASDKEIMQHEERERDEEQHDGDDQRRIVLDYSQESESCDTNLSVADISRSINRPYNHANIPRYLAWKLEGAPCLLEDGVIVGRFVEVNDTDLVVVNARETVGGEEGEERAARGEP